MKFLDRNRLDYLTIHPTESGEVKLTIELDGETRPLGYFIDLDREGLEDLYDFLGDYLSEPEND